MITVNTDHGVFTIDADPADVDQKAGTLTINRDGQPIARFREWLSWHQTNDKQETES